MTRPAFQEAFHMQRQLMGNTGKKREGFSDPDEGGRWPRSEGRCKEGVTMGCGQPLGQDPAPGSSPADCGVLLGHTKGTHCFTGAYTDASNHTCYVHLCEHRESGERERERLNPEARVHGAWYDSGLTHLFPLAAGTLATFRAAERGT